MSDRGFYAAGDYLTAVSRRTGNLYWLLSKHPDFMARVRELWKEKFRPAAEILLGNGEMEEGSVVRPLDDYIERIRASAGMNYARWNVGESTAAKAGKSFDNACRYLKQWITERTAYMDEQY